MLAPLRSSLRSALTPRRVRPKGTSARVRVAGLLGVPAQVAGPAAACAAAGRHRRGRPRAALGCPRRGPLAGRLEPAARGAARRAPGRRAHARSGRGPRTGGRDHRARPARRAARPDRSTSEPARRAAGDHPGRRSPRGSGRPHPSAGRRGARRWAGAHALRRHPARARRRPARPRGHRLHGGPARPRRRPVDRRAAGSRPSPRPARGVRRLGLRRTDSRRRPCVVA